MHRRLFGSLSLALVSLSASACGDSGGEGDDELGMSTTLGTTESGIGTEDSGTSSSTGDGEDSEAGSTTDAGEEEDQGEDRGEGPKFDLGGVPDGGAEGGPVLPPIPENCAQALLVESTVGCSFHANKMQNFIEEPTSLVVGNVSEDQTATVQLYQGVGGNEQAVGGPVSVAPGQAHEFVLNSPTQPGDVSVLRVGGAFRVESDVPLVAYQHSPIDAEAHNDSSMLIPDAALGQNYIVAAYDTNIGSDYSYFAVVGIHDGTVVEWSTPEGTQAGSGVPAVNGGGSAMVTVNHFDMLQVTSGTDVSGTVITTSEPAWVVGAVPCVNVPQNITFCDHIEEQMLPLDYWGQEYVGAHAPQRGSEDYYWRVYAGDDAVTISTDPPQPGTPVTLDQGEWVEFSTTESFMFTGDGPFMPVQYLEGQNGGAGTGDPASYQMVPTEQYLPRYVFVTGTGYNLNYAQIIRPIGGADVFVDGQLVTGYEVVGNFEVADFPITEGAHLAESDQAFGLLQIGYTNVTSYAYPGGLRLATINPQPQG
ncbi:IgGFc-binding protein [Plesiocystis pacifica]|nr:IgGFc-binding protein [Plesiocystis pacifica]